MENFMSSITIPSKNATRNAGVTIIDDSISDADKNDSFEIMNDWRQAHEIPARHIKIAMKNKASRMGFSRAIVASRLKRMHSIVGKLKRQRSMKLDRMQDIAGVRVILPTKEDVYKFHEAITQARFRHELGTCKDYIENPKKDGYRGIHQVFKYQNHRFQQYNGLNVEVQTRTYNQHIWATAVEMIGLIENRPFKTIDLTDDDEYKRFFVLSGEAFAAIDNGTVFEKAEELRETIVNLNILEKLRGAVTVKHIETSSARNDYYHVVVLDMNKKTVSLQPFDRKQMREAMMMYQTVESVTKDINGVDILLLSAGHRDDIKKAYPNYFLDTAYFLSCMNRLCGL